MSENTRSFRPVRIMMQGGTRVPSLSQSDIDEIIAIGTPGKSRVLTPEEIAAEYGERARRPIPPGYKPRPKSFAERHEQSRAMPYAVFKVFDNGRKEFAKPCRTEQVAIVEAGKLRDRMTDDECAGGFTYLPGRQEGRRKK